MSEAEEADRVEGCLHPRETPALYGHHDAEAAFAAAWASGRLHHAWLITGARGIGKATLAYRLARALLAGEAPPDRFDTPPGCPVAARIKAGSEARLTVLRRSLDRPGRADARLTKTIGAEETRALGRILALRVPDGGRRVVIVDAVDECSTQAANALLKNVEEPPERTYFLLLSHRPGGLLPTIRSRCRRLDLAPLGPADLTRALAGQEVEVDTAMAEGLAALGAGSVQAAHALVEAEGLALYTALAQLIAPDGREVDRARLMALADSVGGRARADRYRMALELGVTLTARLARAAAGHPPRPAVPPEAPLLAAAEAAGAPHARALAETAAAMADSAAAAQAANLDPARTVIDTWLSFEARLATPRHPA
ncbi:MAG: DNA polymerase III subunit delta' [Pseudomonadota bacterium]